MELLVLVADAGWYDPNPNQSWWVHPLQCTPHSRTLVERCPPPLSEISITLTCRSAGDDGQEIGVATTAHRGRAATAVNRRCQVLEGDRVPGP